MRDFATRSAVSRTSVSRDALDVFRLPVSLIDLGLTCFWDFRTGKTGVNSPVVKDLRNKNDVGFRGTSSLSSVYTNGVYGADLERSLNDYFSSKAMSYGSGFTELTIAMAFKIETAGGLNRHMISHWDALTNQRGFLLRLDASDQVTLGLSNNGTSQSFYTSAETITDTADWHTVIATYDTTNRGQIYLDGVAMTVTLASGSHISSIFSGGIPTLIGGVGPSSPGNYWDGMIGITELFIGSALTAQEAASIHAQIMTLGEYV